jgi:hypothetical protein
MTKIWRVSIMKFQVILRPMNEFMNEFIARYRSPFWFASILAQRRGLQAQPFHPEN